MLVKSEGIVIKTTDYGESDKIVTLYTRDQGKIGMMARGAKRTKSRLAAISQLLTYGRYLYYQPASGLASLNQGDIIHSYRELKQDLTQTAYAAYVLELVDKLTETGEVNPYLFETLHLTLQYIEEGKDPDIITRIFEVKMLQAAGYRPQVDRCLSCSSEEGPYLFSIREGGLLCNRCGHRDPHAIVLTEGAVKLLRLFQHFDMKRLGNINVKDKTREQLRKALTHFIDEYSGARFKSREFLDQLEKLS
ncbi:MAG: DNA repair protein RecO [Bacillaceae bacterium]|nr:DNA repair protein RecO [Bacillaceae bacterium]